MAAIESGRDEFEQVENRTGTGAADGGARREIIIQTLHRQDMVTVVDLSRQLGVTEVTTRKDLQQLEEQGYLTRVRGGAVMSGRGQLELRFAARQQLFLEEKLPG